MEIQVSIQKKLRKTIYFIFYDSVICELRIIMILFTYYQKLGSGGLGKCPAERMIPIYLLVGGIVCVVVLPLTFVMKAWESCVRKDGPMAVFFKCYNGLFFNSLAVFFLIWFICGNVWVYRITRDVVFTGNIDTTPLYCDELTYRFAYWVIIATYLCSVFSCVLTACIRKRLNYDEEK